MSNKSPKFNQILKKKRKISKESEIQELEDDSLNNENETEMVKDKGHEFTEEDIGSNEEDLEEMVYN